MVRAWIIASGCYILHRLCILVFGIKTRVNTYYQHVTGRKKNKPVLITANFFFYSLCNFCSEILLARKNETPAFFVLGIISSKTEKQEQSHFCTHMTHG